jgi:site-specific DNA recombinase
MSHTYTAKGSRLYRYYVCHRAQKRGWQVCPSPSIPAGEIERFVVDQIKGIGRDPRVIEETWAQARREAEDQIERLTTERAGLVARLRDDHAEVGRLAVTARPSDPRLLDAHDRIRDAERRVTGIDDELATLEGELIDEAEVAAALADFDALWDCLAPREQARVVELLIERVEYDGRAGNIAITLRPAGIVTLAGELANRKEEAA